jgi:hypothetical protein
MAHARWLRAKTSMGSPQWGQDRKLMFSITPRIGTPV